MNKLIETAGEREKRLQEMYEKEALENKMYKIIVNDLKHGADESDRDEVALMARMREKIDESGIAAESTEEQKENALNNAYQRFVHELRK